MKLLKLKDTGNILFSKISENNTNVKIETNHKFCPENPVEIEYELIDGNTLNVLSLSPENLIIEKIAAYKNRRFIRDLYDIYILIKHVKDWELIKSDLSNFLNHLEKPVDEDVLKTIVYLGLSPSYNKIVEYIRQYVNLRE